MVTEIPTRVQGACPHCGEDIDYLVHEITMDEDGHVAEASPDTHCFIEDRIVEDNERVTCTQCDELHWPYDEMTVSRVCVDDDMRFTGVTGL